MMGSKSRYLENYEGSKYVAAKSGEKGKEFSARKLVATLWRIDGLPSHTVRKGILEEKRMDPSKVRWQRRRASAGFQKLLKADFDFGEANSLKNGLVEADQTQNHTRSPCKHLVGSRTHINDVYKSLTTSKELLKLLSRIWHFEQPNLTSISLVSALKCELDIACTHLNKYIAENRSNQNEVDILLKQFMEDKFVWKIKERDRINSAVTSISEELEIEKKLRKQAERLNKKLGKELAETKASLLRATKDLEREKMARGILEQVCDELAEGIGEDKAEVEELKKQSAKFQKEMEKEREMLQLADVIREERVQMKLVEAKYQFEEKNAAVDKLRDELETLLKSKKREEQEDGGSPSYEKIKALEKYLRETLPGLNQCQDNMNDQDQEMVNKEDEDESDDDSDESDLHSIELNMDEINKNFHWNDGVKNESTKNSVNKSKERKSISENIKKPTVPSETTFADCNKSEFTTNKQEILDAVDTNGLFEYISRSWKRNAS